MSGQVGATPVATAQLCNWGEVAPSSGKAMEC
jgi:hypothetical protein